MHNSRASGGQNGSSRGILILQDSIPSQVVQEGIDQRPAPVSCGRMGHHALRLVDDADMIVFIDDTQGDVFWNYVVRNAVLPVNEYPVTGLDPIRRLTGTVVDENLYQPAFQVAPVHAIRQGGKVTV